MMMTDSIILTGLLMLCLVFVGMTFWQLKKSMDRMLEKQQSSEQSELAAHHLLGRQVSDIQQTMTGVISTLQTMGNQVHHLNTLADHALQEAQAYAEEDEDDDGSPRILIELRPQAMSPMLPQQPQQVVNPEDLSPEMQEKFKTFRSVYGAILSKPDFPSRQRPDLN